jgi:hypothetical protein
MNEDLDKVLNSDIYKTFREGNEKEPESELVVGDK